jgi:hypothetical protein
MENPPSKYVAATTSAPDPSDLLPRVPTFRYVVCDVFTDRPLTGNQLGVFTDARDLDDETMQSLARELNYSETVFRRCDVPIPRR